MPPARMHNPKPDSKHLKQFSETHPNGPQFVIRAENGLSVLGMRGSKHPMQPARLPPDDLDARTRRIRDKLLDSIEATLDELAQPRTIHDAVSRAVQRAMQSHRAALLCRQALCRRAKRCRRDPCAVSEESPFR